MKDVGQLMEYVRMVGEGSCLVGRRKGAFRELFLGMAAVYETIFRREVGGGNNHRKVKE